MPRQTRRRRRPGVIAVGVLLLLLALVMTPWGVAQVGSHDRVLRASEVPDGSVGVVLGAGVREGGTPSPFLQGRLDLTAELWEQGRLSAIVVSGNGEATYNEPAAMRTELISDGVPAAVIVEDEAGFDTYDTCVRAREIYGIDEVVLISQYYHLPRAITVCRMVGVDAYGVGDASVRSHSRTWWYGEFREIGAAWKMLLDVGVRREPTLGLPSDEVREITSG